MVFVQVPECWHGDICPWHKQCMCLLRLRGPRSGRVGREEELVQHVRGLRGALAKLAAAVLWRGEVPVVVVPETVRASPVVVVVAPVTDDTGKVVSRW